MEYMAPLTYRVEPEDDGVSLKVILGSRMKLSRTLLAKLKQTERGIELNGQRVYTSVKVRSGDLVEVRMAVEASDDILPENLPIEVLYEDDHLLVVNKSAGMIVHPTHGHYTGTLANAVVYYWLSKHESIRFRPIHRLDQDTSGVLAIAKSPYVHQHVSEQMKNRQVDKSYIAFVHGKPEPAAGKVDEPIDRSDENPHIRIVRLDGYPSITYYETVEVYGSGALMRIRLETGRTHQIRVHMKHIGHPLIGDPMYGLDDLPPDGGSGMIRRHALHAESLSFSHPILGERMTFTAPWPEDLSELRNQLLREYVERK